MTDERLIGWTRVHDNGMVALVLELPWTKDNDEYSYGAMASGATKPMGRIKGLAAAQWAADRESGCSPTCTCAAWAA